MLQNRRSGSPEAENETAAKQLRMQKRQFAALTRLT
jgi:hypothetical protein